MLTLRETADHPLNNFLGPLNQIFHEHYEKWQAKAERLIHEGEVPVLIRLDNRLVLIEGERQEEHQINSERFHELKALCHLPLAVYLILAGADNKQHELWPILENLPLLSGTLDDPDELKEAIKRAILQLSAGTNEAERDLSHQAVKLFARELKPVFNRLVEEAAFDEVTALMKVMSIIKEKIGDEQKWARAYFVICAGHQPRYKQITKKFFERWLLEETHSKLDAVHRVIYAEGCASLEEVLKLVCTRMVSADLGEVFLHSPLSLDEDVLGDAGLAAIETLFKQQKP